MITPRAKNLSNKCCSMCSSTSKQIFIRHHKQCILLVCNCCCFVSVSSLAPLTALPVLKDPVPLPTNPQISEKVGIPATSTTRADALVCACILSLSLFVRVNTEYVAMYTYESSEQGDLTFQQGDVITVTKKEGDWWTGTVGGRTGVFPSNYVKPKESEVMAW